MQMPAAATKVLRFWFEEHGEEDWFSASADFDALIAERFGDVHTALALGEGQPWRMTAEGRLAEIVVLDQFSRQLYRGDPRAFAQDGMAIVLAQEAVGQGAHEHLPPRQRAFLYMPFMHAESLAVHDFALPLFEALGNEGLLAYEMAHRRTLEQFGRYPMRNKALGRETTPAERAYMTERDGEMF